MIKCPICSAENDDSERFCRDCGQKLPTLSRERPADNRAAASAPSIGEPAGSDSPTGALSQHAENPGAPASVVCPSCSAVNDSSFRYCKSCGHSIVSPPSQTGSSSAATREEPGQPPAPPLLPDDVPARDEAPAPPASPASGAPSESKFAADRELEAPSVSAVDSTPAGPALGPVDYQAAAPPDEATFSPPPTAAPAPPAPPSISTRGSAESHDAQSGAALVCPSCGKKAAGTERFCSECGARLQPEAAAASPLVCPSCSTEYAEGDKFCKGCGTRLPTNGGEAAGPRLVLTANGDETVYPLDRAEIAIGRAPSNDIAITSDGYISSYHARVVVESGAVYVEDAGSTNGTFLRVRGRIQLSEGDEIKVGQSILKFIP